MTARFNAAGKHLKVDLSRGLLETTENVHYERFVGGRGTAAKLYWDAVDPVTRAFDPANRLIFSNGPLAGVPGLAGSRWQVSGKAPLLAGDTWSYANFGGSWGAWLKFTGYDSIEVVGQAERPVYLLLKDGKAELRDASAHWGNGAIATRTALKSEHGPDTRVAAIGPAGEARVVYATILADEDASGSSGFGAVMGAKKLKAIAIQTANRRVAVANPEAVSALGKHYRDLSRGSRYMYCGAGGARSPGVARLDPAHNPKLKKAACWGCGNGCPRSWYTFENGSRVKILCVSAAFYGPFVVRHDRTWNDNAFQAARLCNDVGLDTNSLMPLVMWLDRAFKAGVLSEETAGLKLSEIGSLEFLQELAGKMCRREGFGDALADGIFKAAEASGPAGRALVKDIFFRTGQIYPYEPREYITTALLYPMEPRLHTPLAHEVVFPAHWWLDWHQKAEGAYVDADVLQTISRDFLGGEEAEDFSTYAGKAQAARRIQDRVTSKECLVMCDFAWPVMESREGPGHRGDPGLMARVFSAVTGRETDEAGLNLVGERVFNLQRAIAAREGHGGRSGDRLEEFEYTQPLAGGLGAGAGFRVPGKGAEMISRAGAMVDRVEFEKMKDEYYALRGWDIASGLQKAEGLRRLGLGDIVEDLAARGLAV
jgi:aldehyde:ferredoxin oxidoreductase